MAENSVFAIGIGEMLTLGWRGYRANILSLTLGAGITFATFGITRLFVDVVDGPLTKLLVQLAGLVVTSAAALPWYRAALHAVDGTKTAISALFSQPSRFVTMLFASVFVWAGIQFGVRYLRGIPAIFVIVMYGFYGFIIADRPSGASKALGESVLLGQGRKMGIAAVAGILLLLNLAGALPVGAALTVFPGVADYGLGSTPGATALAVAMLVVTTSWSMVCGAAVFRALEVREQT